jgi:hypothetical protein
MESVRGVTHIAVTSITQTRRRQPPVSVAPLRLDPAAVADVGSDHDDVLMRAYDLVAASHYRQRVVGQCLTRWRAHPRCQLALRQQQQLSRVATQFRTLTVCSAAMQTWREAFVAAQRRRRVAERIESLVRTRLQRRVVREWRSAAQHLRRRRRHRDAVTGSSGNTPSGPRQPSALALCFARNACICARGFFHRWRIVAVRRLCLRFLTLRRTRVHLQARLVAWRNFTRQRQREHFVSDAVEAKIERASAEFTLSTTWTKWRAEVMNKTFVRLQSLHDRQVQFTTFRAPMLLRRVLLRRWRCALNVAAMRRGKLRDTTTRILQKWQQLARRRTRQRRVALALEADTRRQARLHVIQRWAAWAHDTHSERRANAHFARRITAKIFRGWRDYHRLYQTQRAMLTVNAATLEQLGPLAVLDGRIPTVGVPPPTRQELARVLQPVAAARSPLPSTLHSIVHASSSRRRGRGSWDSVESRTPAHRGSSAGDVSTTSEAEPPTARAPRYRMASSVPQRSHQVYKQMRDVYYHSDNAITGLLSSNPRESCASRLAARPLPQLRDAASATPAEHPATARKNTDRPHHQQRLTVRVVAPSPSSSSAAASASDDESPDDTARRMAPEHEDIILRTFAAVIEECRATQYADSQGGGGDSLFHVLSSSKAWVADPAAASEQLQSALRLRERRERCLRCLAELRPIAEAIVASRRREGFKQQQLSAHIPVKFARAAKLSGKERDDVPHRRRPVSVY